jgi:hypothetical protein
LNPEFTSVPLADHHAVAGFDCGVASLNEWLAQHALRAQHARTARTFVWIKPKTPNETWAYFSLAPTEVTARR